ncbi:MAG: hypothetical protein LRY27_00625 [Chitinophagales bacterium]|nr:hypothetical protein [Chitinophagales bacterium]
MESLKKDIEKWIAPMLQEMDLFLVDIAISANFKIQVFIDGIPSVTIEQCTKISRHIEKMLDENSEVPENYNLEVSSPGMGNPLKVPQQYKKRIGSTLKITLNNGEQIALILKEIENDDLTGLKTKIETGKSKRPVKKVKEEDLETIKININDIKQAYLHFNF